MLGNYDKKISKNEEKNHDLMRRSIYFNKKLKKGTLLQRQDLKIVRPHKISEPNDLLKILGKELKRCDVKELFLISTYS